jgi:hypothetical protein
MNRTEEAVFGLQIRAGCVSAHGDIYRVGCDCSKEVQKRNAEYEATTVFRQVAPPEIELKLDRSLLAVHCTGLTLDSCHYNSVILNN